MLLRPRPTSEHGFTLVELTIVLVIIGILITVPLASYLSYRDKADSAVARADVSVIAPSIEAYYAETGHTSA